MNGINGRHKSYSNSFSFINEWNKTLEIEDELQRRIQQRAILLRRLSEEDIIAQESVHTALADVISDYDKIIQKLKEVKELQNTKQLTDEQIKYVEGILKQTAQVKTKAEQNKKQISQNYSDKSAYDSEAGLLRSGFNNVQDTDKLLDQSKYEKAKKQAAELRKELTKLQDEMKKYADFENLSAYDKIQAAELQSKTAAVQLQLSEQELFVSNVEKTKQKQQRDNAKAYKASRDAAAAAVKALQEEQAALNGLTQAQEKQIRLDKIQAEAKQKKLEYTQQQLEAIDQERQKLKQLNEEKARLDKFNSVMESLSQQNTLLNLEQGSDKWYLQMTKQKYSDLNLSEQTTIAQTQKQLNEQTRRISALKILENKHADILTRFGEMFDKSKTGQLQRAIKSFEKNAGYQLTGDDRRKFESLFNAQWAMNQEKPILELVSGIKTNSLTSRGGWAAGATNIPTIQSINKRIASYNLKQINILNEIKRAIDNSGRI